MFTALFALARTVGWVAQWNEMISDPAQKIGRPCQLYTGPTQRDYVPVAQRCTMRRARPLLLAIRFALAASGVLFPSGRASCTARVLPVGFVSVAALPFIN